MDVADFFGIASGNKMDDKFERTGYTAIKSEHMNVPIIDEFPVVMECELAEAAETESFYCIVGKIIYTAAELARRMGMSPQNLNAKLKRDTFSVYDMERIAKAAGAGFRCEFILENGETV